MSFIRESKCWGAVIIIKCEDGYYLEAGSNDTGKSWKSPLEAYPTIKEAVEKAESIWKPS
jgi:hypothetical protein